MCLSLHAQPQATSPTEDAITSDFVEEHEMKNGLMEMLSQFSTYLKNDFLDLNLTNDRGESIGCFRSNSTMKNNEDGVRSNADLSMITAFLCKYGPNRVSLPQDMTWTEMEQIATKSLVWAYSTHKAVRLARCKDGNYWGSTRKGDSQWESNLWAMSVAYSAFFLWDKLSSDQRESIYKLLKAECNYELQRDIPTGYKGDTMAEENGWDACVLAATIGLFPNDELAPKWFDRLRRFAINAYSHSDDANDATVIDPGYDTASVKGLHIGINLYPDYTLQNHDYFHTSYQNVVIQELGEAALAMKLFQQGLHGHEKWATRALTHNCLEVQNQVLNWLALADGELAMPNGNDWSLFLYDQITSYTTNATLLHDSDALMLENLAYKMIRARQSTTTDGSWLLRSDIGARRMGVEGHRVMMTWLMHETNSTESLSPSSFEDFRKRYEKARIFKSQNIVRAYTPDRFTCFSWAPGIKSYTGYIAANSPDKNKIIVPFKDHNTGNFLGWYRVGSRKTNAQPVLSGNYQLKGTAWTMNGQLLTNDSTLDHRFVIYSTPGNAVIYLDYVSALATDTIIREQGGLMAISTDDFTQTARTLYYADSTTNGTLAYRLNGEWLKTFSTDWINIDNAVGIIGKNGKLMAFGDRADNNSVMTSKLYAAYDDRRRVVNKGDVVDARNLVYYSNISVTDTRRMNDALIPLRKQLPIGWNGVIAGDPDGTRYLTLSNFKGKEEVSIQDISTANGAPVFDVMTTIKDNCASANFTLAQNNSVSIPIEYYVRGSHVKALCNDGTLSLTASENTEIIVYRQGFEPIQIKLKAKQAAIVSEVDGQLTIQKKH